MGGAATPQPQVCMKDYLCASACVSLQSHPSIASVVLQRGVDYTTTTGVYEGLSLCVSLQFHPSIVSVVLQRGVDYTTTTGVHEGLSVSVCVCLTLASSA